MSCTFPNCTGMKLESLNRTETEMFMYVEVKQLGPEQSEEIKIP